MKKNQKPLELEVIFEKPTKLDLELEKCRRAYETNNPIAVLRALQICRETSLPDWLYLALVGWLHNYLIKASSGMGRHARWATRYRQDCSDLLAHQTVYERRKKGLKGDDIYDEAAKILTEELPELDSWSFDSVENGSRRFRRRTKENRYAYWGIDPLLPPERMISEYIVDVLLHPKHRSRDKDLQALTERYTPGVSPFPITGQKQYKKHPQHRARP